MNNSAGIAFMPHVIHVALGELAGFVSKYLGASLFGILLSKSDPVTCLKLAAGFMIWGLPLTVALTWLTNMVLTGVLDRANCLQTFSECNTRLTHPGK